MAVNMRTISVCIRVPGKNPMYLSTKSHKRAPTDHFLHVQKDDPVFIIQRLSLHISDKIMTFRKRTQVKNLLYKETDK